MKKSLTVLITGVGAPGTRGTLYALRTNPRTKVRVVGTDIKESAVGRFFADHFHTLPPPEDEGYVDEVNRICALRRVDLIVPQTTRETAALAKAKSRLSVPATVSAWDSVRKANDKLEVLRVFEKLRLPFPRYERASSTKELEEAAKKLGYPDVPVVVKPPVSFGSRGFRVLVAESSWTRSRFLSEKPEGAEIALADLLGVLRSEGEARFPELIATEYLPGYEYTVDAFRGVKAAVALPRRRDEVVNGISFQTTMEYRKDIAGYTLRAAEELGLTCAFGFQYKMDSAGVPKVLECNPRVQGTMVASVFSGVNVVWMAVEEAMGEPPSAPRSRPRDASFRRFWGGVGLRGDKLLDEI